MPSSVQEAIQDPGFQAAPVPQQVAYLAHVDPDFKNANAEDQLAYLNHITGKQAPTTANNAAENRELPQDTSRASLWQKAKAIPAALAPDENTHPLDAAGRMVSGAWSGLKAMNPFQGATDTSPEHVRQMRDAALDPMKALGPAGGAIESAYHGYKGARSEGSGVIPSVGAGLASMFGLDTPGIKERASEGDVAGLIGEGIPAIGATLIGGEAHRLPDVKAGIANLARTPEGELHPILEKAARVGGAAAGHILGPVGSIAGYEAGPGILSKMIPDRIPTVEKPFAPQGPKLPAELAGPGGIPVVGDKPLTLRNPDVEPEQAIQQKMEFPAVEEAPKLRGSAINRLPDLVEQGAGVRDLDPAVPLRNQLPNSVGAAAEGFAPAVDPTKSVPLREQRQLQKPFGNRAAVEVSEMQGPRTVAPEKIPQVLSNAVDEAMGADLTPEAKEKARLQQKYPDAGDRQAIYRTSEKIVDATADNPKLRKALGDLPAHDNKGGPDLARAAANLGEDLGEKRIGNKKAEWMGAGQIGRSEMFDRLLDKGYTPQEIFDAAHAEPKAGKPGLMRAASERPAREKTGD